MIVPQITEARALYELRGHRGALRRKAERRRRKRTRRRTRSEGAQDRVWAAEARLDAIRSQQPERHQGAWAA